jgi:hypothetical protein
MNSAVVVYAASQDPVARGLAGGLGLYDQLCILHPAQGCLRKGVQISFTILSLQVSSDACCEGFPLMLAVACTSC